MKCLHNMLNQNVLKCSFLFFIMNINTLIVLVIFFNNIPSSFSISEQRFKDVHGIATTNAIEVGVEEWTHDVSLKIFEIREKYGTPLSKMERNEKNMLKRRAINAYYKKEKEKERIEEERQKPRKKAKRFCDHLGCRAKGLKISLSENGIIFCKDCPDPRKEGSYIPTWNSHYNKEKFIANGALVYMVPNDGSSEVVNAEDVLRRIAFVKRGVVSLVEKAKHAQKAGARAVIIIDGNCTRAVDGLRCENEVEAKANGDGFAKKDPEWHWSEIRIPVVMISRGNGARLHNMMDLDQMHMPEYGGIQFYDIHLNE